MSKKGAVAVLVVGLIGAGVYLWRRSQVEQGATLDDSPLDIFRLPPEPGINFIYPDSWLPYLGIDTRTASTAAPTRYQFTTPPAGMPFEQYFVEATNRYGLPPGLLSRQAMKESGYNPNATSFICKLGEAEAGRCPVGIMQINPRWHPGCANAWDARTAILYAGDLLARYQRRFGGWAEALAAYNMGDTGFARLKSNAGENWFAALPRETKNYLTEIGRDVGLITAGSAQAVA